MISKSQEMSISYHGVQKQAYAWLDTHQNLKTRKLTRCFQPGKNETNTYQVLGHILAHQ